MALTLVRADRQYADSAQSLNVRLADAGHGRFALPMPRVEGASASRGGLERRAYYVLDGSDVVGGAELVLQPVVACGKRIEGSVNIQAPLSAGLIDKRYATVAPWMMRELLKMHPHMYAVGMGGLQQPFPRLLAAMRWGLREVSFRVRILRGGAVFRELPMLHSTPRRSQLSGIIGRSGLAGLATSLLNGAMSVVAPGGRRATPVQSFGDWADSVWASQQDRLQFAAVRDAATLNRMYPAGGDDRVARHRIEVGDRTIGWTATITTRMQKSPFFGDLTVGTLLDVLAMPGSESDVLGAAVETLRASGADVIVANATDTRLLAALSRHAFVRAPSNYLLATSPALTTAMAACGDGDAWPCVLTRGDGDGRIHM